jgi:hypothetical protein
MIGSSRNGCSQRSQSAASLVLGALWPTLEIVDTEVRRALDEQLSVRDACGRWYSGAFLLETVPSALYILARHAGNPETAIMRAVNDTKDNDTIAAIVGAAVSALHGRLALPSRWVDGLLGRTAGGNRAWGSDCVDLLAGGGVLGQPCLRDLRKPDVGESIWSRFSQPREKTLRYYRSLADKFRERWPGQLANAAGHLNPLIVPCQLGIIVRAARRSQA